MAAGWARAVISLGLGLAMAAAGVPGAAQRQPPRKPVPDAEARQKALAILDEVYGPERDAADTPEGKTLLAKKMLEQAAETRGKLADQFVLIRAAGDLAAAAGDAKLAVEAARMMAARFEIDPREAELKALDDVASAVKFTAQRKLLAETAAGLIEEALAADQLEAAQRLAKIALEQAQNARDIPLAQQVVAQQEEIQARKEAYAPVAEALAVLAKRPTDPAANRTVGSYRCLWKGDWERGIPMLALASDPATSPLAVKELMGPASSDEKIALADGWWDLGESQDGRQREAYLLRAGHWYKQVPIELVAGLAKMKIEQRLAVVTELEAGAADSGNESEENEWQPLRADGMLTRGYMLGPYVENLPDAPIIGFIGVGFIHKAKPGREYAGRKLVAVDAVMKGDLPQFIGPQEPRTKMYFAFCVRTDRNQNVQFKADTFGAKDYNTLAVVVDGVPVATSGVLPLKRGLHVVIIKQNHHKGDTPDRSWLTVTMRGQPPLDARR